MTTRYMSKKMDKDHYANVLRAAEKRSIKVKVGEVRYDSISQASKHLRVSCAKIRNAMKTGDLINNLPVTRG